MNEQTHPEVVILNAALELPLTDRAAYLDRACAGQPELRRQVEALIQANDQATSFLQHPPNGLHFNRTLPLPILPREKPGDQIGHYKLLQQIGEGGCGIVYMAEQEEPVRRRVALKVIKLGMDTRQVIARFEAERQALALMDHPNIAKVLDAGSTSTGRPYFVMELVRGIKITDYCDENNLPTAQRLDLFLLVCHAIQHAHQKGIIHRDIKPSNILIADHDGVPVPKIIDFGIAKATTDQRLTDKTLFTAFEQFIGTPAYMSPEQAKLSGLDVDTRSDIYSLGVLLYELLTGQTPFDPEQLLSAGLEEMRRTIREMEPPRPSTRLSTMLAADLTKLAKHRRAEASKLPGLIRGDLDWIVMKCLEKDRTRRYETANGLATDISRHLHNEPVVARPPSRLYRFQKSVQRNKLAFAAASAFALALVVGAVVSIWLLVIKNAAARRALIAERTAATERLKNDQATASLVKSGTAFTDAGDLRSAEKLLRDALASRNTAPEGGDRLAADLLDALGRVYKLQKDLDAAESQTRAALEIRRHLRKDDPSLAWTLNALGEIREDRGDMSDAERLFSEGLAVMRRNGTNSPGTLLWSLYGVAAALEHQAKFDQAEPFYRELLLRPDAHKSPADLAVSPATAFARCLTDWAWTEHQQGKSAQAARHAREAESLLRESLSVRLEQAIDSDWQLAEIRSRLGGTLVVATVTDTSLQPTARADKFAEAEPLLLESEEQLRSHRAVPARYKRAAIERLVRLYESWDGAAPNLSKAGKAAEWRQKLALFDEDAAGKVVASDGKSAAK